MEAFPHRSLLDIEGLTRVDVERILDTAEAFLQVSRRPVRKVPTLRGKTVINLFYEASTRTRTSFELAGKRLSADVINMSVSASSVKKGETLQDTCRTLEAMHPDVIVIRHNASGASNYVASKIGCSVINAGDGMHAEHARLQPAELGLDEEQPVALEFENEDRGAQGRPPLGIGFQRPSRLSVWGGVSAAVAGSGEPAPSPLPGVSGGSSSKNESGPVVRSSAVVSSDSSEPNGSSEPSKNDAARSSRVMGWASGSPAKPSMPKGSSAKPASEKPLFA